MNLSINHSVSKISLVVLCALNLASCGGSSDKESDSTVIEENTEIIISVDPFNFEGDALVEAVTIESCTLTNGEQTECYRFVVAGVPANHEIGVFCPTDINSSADEAGIWFDGNGEVYDITGDFIVNLATLYNDVTV